MNSADLRSKHQEFLFPCVANYYDEPIVLTQGQGSFVRDLEGRDYLDFFGGILTVSLGHCEPRVVEALTRQARQLGHVSTLYPTENLVRVAERMAKLTPGKLKKSFFSNSGTEANETAVMLAKIHTGRQEIIALRHGYAGRSALAMSLTGQSTWRLLPAEVPGVKHGHPGYCYRCPFGATYPSCNIECARDLEELIQTETNGKPAAFLAEPILGIGGFITPPKEYFQIAVGIVRNYGGLFICDEVQTGFGRTGGRWFGIEHYGVEPDIMTFAKGIANGMPVGATITTDEIASSMRGLSISTFGGNPITMAAADATMQVMEDEDVPTRSEQLGNVLRQALEDLGERFAFVGDVRGMGLMQGIELVEDRATKEPAPKKAAALLEAARREGLLIGKSGRWGNVLRIAPPMLISKSELEAGIEKLERAFVSVR